MKTICWLLFSHLKVYFEISKIKISHFPYECMLRDLSALCSVSCRQSKQLLRAKINLESVRFEPLTKLEPIFYTKIVIFKSNFHQEAVKGRGQT